MENIMVAAVYLIDKYTYTIKKNSNIVGSFRKKKKVTISLQRGTASGISSQSSAVLIYKRKKKRKK